MIFIILTAMVVYFILIAWTWHSLGFLEKSKKVIFLIVGIFIMYIITLLIFQIAKANIHYENIQIQKSIQNILVAIFTGINGVIALPQIGKIVDKVKEEEIGKNEQKKRIAIIIIVFMVCLIFELGYMKDTQEGILKIYHAEELKWKK